MKLWNSFPPKLKKNCNTKILFRDISTSFLENEIADYIFSLYAIMPSIKIRVEKI